MEGIIFREKARQAMLGVDDSVLLIVEGKWGERKRKRTSERARGGESERERERYEF